MENVELSQSSYDAEDDINSESLEPNFSHSFAQWIDGIDLETMQPKPFDLELEDFYTQSELDSIIDGKTKEECAEIIRNNHKVLLRNNEKIEQFDNHIIEMSELSKADLEALYHDEGISESDKSIISCIGILRASFESGLQSNDDYELFINVWKAIKDCYGFCVFFARETLEKENSNFRILTKKEREELPPGSIEEIASVALESFVMNPNYANQRITEYDDYLHGIMLDCTKRRVKKENEIDIIEEEVDSEEFQERVIESMSWALIDEESKNKEYSKEELGRILEQSADLHADWLSGHHFLNDLEVCDNNVRVAGQDSPESIYAYNHPDREDSFWKRFKKRIQSNNDEVFRYSEELANAEMKQWAKKIDLDEIERINNNNELGYEQKLASITLYVQKALGVLNLDNNGQSCPIEVKWFRHRESKLKKAIKKLFGISTENEELPEENATVEAFYSQSERSIYYQKLSKPNQKLSDWMIATVAHEMWHAKQYELKTTEQTRDFYIINGDLKTRMYYKNDLAYFALTAVMNGSKGYYAQIMEREAYALGKQIAEALKRRHNKEMGRRVLNAILGI